MREHRLAALITPVLAAHGLELDAVEVVPIGRRKLVRITVDGDGPNGSGPTLDEIAVATGSISAALDESSETGDAPYTLEVSSRGVRRPLTDPRHWRRNAGRLVKVSLAEGGEVTGRICASDATGATLDDDGQAHRVEYSQVRRALIQVELRAMPEADDDDSIEEA